MTTAAATRCAPASASLVEMSAWATTATGTREIAARVQVARVHVRRGLLAHRASAGAIRTPSAPNVTTAPMNPKSGTADRAEPATPKTKSAPAARTSQEY